MLVVYDYIFRDFLQMTSEIGYVNPDEYKLMVNMV